MNALRKLAVIDCGTNTFNLRVVEMGAKEADSGVSNRHPGQIG